MHGGVGCGVGSLPRKEQERNIGLARKNRFGQVVEVTRKVTLNGRVTVAPPVKPVARPLRLGHPDRVREADVSGHVSDDVAEVTLELLVAEGLHDLRGLAPDPADEHVRLRVELVEAEDGDVPVAREILAEDSLFAPSDLDPLLAALPEGPLELEEDLARLAESGALDRAHFPLGQRRGEQGCVILLDDAERDRRYDVVALQRLTVDERDDDLRVGVVDVGDLALEPHAVLDFFVQRSEEVHVAAGDSDVPARDVPKGTVLSRGTSL